MSGKIKKSKFLKFIAIWKQDFLKRTTVSVFLFAFENISPSSFQRFSKAK
jgi:hypothetical protein